MGSLKKFTLSFALTAWLPLSGCQMGYIFQSAYNQMKLLNARVPMDKALKDPKLTEEEKRKLLLAQEVRQFAETELHLVTSKNYSSYVQLDRPYVTYVVSAAPKWELKHYEWSYPFLGRMPYKGYFNEADAKKQEQELIEQNLDTYLRGVSAFSTLGWFDDPLLSSMLRYQDYDLVNTIIHETVHATLYIKHAGDFNERLASFLGAKGAELFYLKKEGPNSPTLQWVRNDNADEKRFSDFISGELKTLGAWYKTIPEAERAENKRQEQFRMIQTRFETDVLPQMKTDNYKRFKEAKLNNARLLIYKTYMQDLSDFEKLFQKVGGDFRKFLEACKALEDSKNPDEALKAL
ncbi:aminopeptidase [Bdellovibrio sp. HCB2-146]|uniref:aminopeptidase n=1 Tax=Bdellovibrio sp. HCB2-146 TaxID=3394362 RepID=UPI0039BD0334